MRYRTITRKSLRAGYTLLEVTVALGIAVILLYSLYQAFYILVRQTEAGRNVIEEANIVRSVFIRMSDDVASHLAAIDPRVAKVPPEITGTEETTDSTTNQDSGTGGTGNSGNSSSTTTPQTTTSSSSENNMAFFNFGVQGTSTTLSLYISKVPNFQLSPSPDQEYADTISDLRRVTYWVASDASGPVGLARHEALVATSDDGLQTMPMDMSDLNRFVIAREVVEAYFEYFDGSQWVAEWDGTAAGADGSTPVGPPMAIRVRLKVLRPGNRPELETSYTMYEHVISVPTANGVPPSDLEMGGTMQGS